MGLLSVLSRYCSRSGRNLNGSNTKRSLQELTALWQKQLISFVDICRSTQDIGRFRPWIESLASGHPTQTIPLFLGHYANLFIQQLFTGSNNGELLETFGGFFARLQRWKKPPHFKGAFLALATPISARHNGRYFEAMSVVSRNFRIWKATVPRYR